MASTFVTALKRVYGAIASAIVSEQGVMVGRTADPNRVELHSWNEGEPMDKDNRVRQLSCIVESMSTTSLGVALSNAEKSVTTILSEQDIVPEGFKIVGVIPADITQTEEMSEANNTIYKVLATMRIYVEKEEEVEE